MRIALFILASSVSLAAIASARAAEPEAKPDSILFSDSFENAELGGRGWYDGAKFRVIGDAMAGKGCIEY